jgi:hypothetical protein
MCAQIEGAYIFRDVEPVVHTRDGLAGGGFALQHIRRTEHPADVMLPQLPEHLLKQYFGIGTIDLR